MNTNQETLSFDLVENASPTLRLRSSYTLPLQPFFSVRIESHKTLRKRYSFQFKT
jgi:hypothetical protein